MKSEAQTGVWIGTMRFLHGEDETIEWQKCSVCGREVIFVADDDYEHCPKCLSTMIKPVFYQQNNADFCISCGEIIPEGRQICPKCERYE